MFCGIILGGVWDIELKGCLGCCKGSILPFGMNCGLMAVIGFMFGIAEGEGVRRRFGLREVGREGGIDAMRE